MPIKNKSRSTLIFGLGVSLTLIFGQLNPAVAQTSNSADQGDQSNEIDPLYGGTFGNLNPMDLIHNSRFNNGRSSEEFGQDSQVQINDSASEFKRLQQQRMLQSQPNTTPTKPEEAVTK